MPAAISSRGERHGVARAVVDLQKLEPGRYVVRADVFDEDRNVGFAERTIMIAR
jgi:hypothetical protein